MDAHTGHILAVDDDATIADVLAATRADPPDLVLLDVALPGLDGPEVCRRLNADARTRRAPVAFVTAAPAERLAGRPAGCRYGAVIREPFALRDLLGTVWRLLRRGAAASR